MPETLDLTCPICKKEFANEDLLAWHAFLNEMPMDKGNVTFICFCGKPVTMIDYDHHLRNAGGVVYHYHASVLGVKPDG